MDRTELLDLIGNGEDSFVEFKRDDVRDHDLAKDLVAFLNLEGGIVLLGVEDDGSFSGTTRDRLEEWTVGLCRTMIEPSVVPTLAWAREAEGGRDVLAVRIAAGPDKPYARVHDNRRSYYVRVGGKSWETSREELERIYPASSRLRYGMKPVPGADLDALDLRRLSDYLTRVLDSDAPAKDDRTGWETLLENMGLMIKSAGMRVATVEGLLLFGRTPQRHLRQSGVRAVRHTGVAPGRAARADEDLRGPLAPLGTADGAVAENGLVDQAWDFVRRNTEPTAHLEGARRVDGWEYPESAVREALVNALIHRDYSISGTEVVLAIHTDRLEIRSPGRLPGTVTVESMKAGLRYARNQTLVNVMRDYGYVEVPGIGVRTRIVPAMRAHNGTEPDFIEEEHCFTVRLWRAPEST